MEQWCCHSSSWLWDSDEGRSIGYVGKDSQSGLLPPGSCFGELRQTPVRGCLSRPASLCRSVGSRSHGNSATPNPAIPDWTPYPLL
eukprot:764997-Hanusia_phi.AAC.1